MTVLQVSNLKKLYDHRVIWDGVSFAAMYGAGVVEAFSAGSRPSGQVNPQAVAAMRELGYDLSRHAPKGLWAACLSSRDGTKSRYG